MAKTLLTPDAGCTFGSTTLANIAESFTSGFSKVLDTVVLPSKMFRASSILNAYGVRSSLDSEEGTVGMLSCKVATVS